MRQLWINNKRMDSIAQLQQEFAYADKNTAGKMCIQILRHCEQDGGLLDWLIRQPERALPKNAVLPMNAASLESLIKCLQNHPGIPEDTKLLAALCGIDADVFTKAAVPDDGRAEKIQLFERQGWWPQAKEVLERVKDWSRVVYNNRQLDEILMHRSAAGEGEKPSVLVVYLCNVRGSYFFNPPAYGRSVKLIGCGNPVVRLDPSHKYSDIDMAALNLKFEDLTLRNAYGVKWKGWDAQTVNCIMLGGEE